LQSIYIEATENSPEVVLNYESKLIELSGKSYPENTFEFYEPILEWLRDYFSYQTETTVNIKLTYFNSATTQILFDILDIMQESDYSYLNISWYYDSKDEHGMEDYEDYSEEFPDLNITAVPF
jgi:hypothetical protein